MKSIQILNDGELETEYLDVDICSHTAEYCPYGRPTGCFREDSLE